MRFSERMGIVPIRAVVQVDGMDDDLRNALWSALQVHYWDTVRRDSSNSFSQYLIDQNPRHRSLCGALWIDHFKQPIDTLDHDWRKVHRQLRDFHFKASWFQVYDFIEFVAQRFGDDKANDAFVETCNTYLEREVSAFRFAGRQLVPVVAESELDEIGRAAESNFDAVREHIGRAVSLFGDRTAPDYRNSIKESISAVEALVVREFGKGKGTLGDLLKRIDGASGIHQALRSAFEKLYGYTSDEKGIRHALSEDSRCSADEARFMLVACSAFVNYIESKLASSSKE